LELKVTDISFGAVPHSVFTITPPAGTKVTHLSPPTAAARHGAEPPAVTGLAAVRRQAGFQVAAPQRLAGKRRSEVRLVSSGRHSGALVTYGSGLAGMAVVELPADAGHSASGPGANRSSPEGGRVSLPKVSIDGTSGQELDTALGTVIRFQRRGVQYIVAGSVPPATARAAARGL
jgi:hypothetical protein